MKTAFVLSFVRGAGCTLAAFVSFLLVGSTLAAWAPFPDVPMVAPKLTHFAQDRTKFDALFIGSSRVQFQVIPELFDKLAGTHSFNLGVAGMLPPESFYVVRRVLGLHPSHLKWIFIELPDLDPLINPRNADTARAVYWHDARHTAIACHNLWQTRRSTARKLESAAAHLRLFARRTTNIGLGAPWVAGRLAPPTRNRIDASLAENERFRTVLDRPLTADQLDRIHASLTELHSRPWSLQPVRPAYREALHDLIRAIRRAGAEPIFFIAPTSNWRDRLTGVPDGVPLLTFHDEARYPALFDPRNYSDTIHLNMTGSVLFTTALAEQFAALSR